MRLKFVAASKVRPCWTSIWRAFPVCSLLAAARRMTRRSYHMYIFRIDEATLGLTRDEFLKALTAEGVPASEGWYRPLYHNGVFRNAHQGPVHGIRAPLAQKGVDYRKTSCSVCEQVCRDAVWIPQNALLAEPPQIENAATAIRKVVACADQLRQRAAHPKRPLTGNRRNEHDVRPRASLDT